MSWNYRVIRRQYPDGLVIFAIHEVFYNEAGDNKRSVTAGPCWVQGETLAGLKKDMSYYKLAFGKPVLDYDTLEEVEA